MCLFGLLVLVWSCRLTHVLCLCCRTCHAALTVLQGCCFTRQQVPAGVLAQQALQHISARRALPCRAAGERTPTLALVACPPSTPSLYCIRGGPDPVCQISLLVYISVMHNNRRRGCLCLVASACCTVMAKLPWLQSQLLTMLCCAVWCPAAALGP